MLYRSMDVLKTDDVEGIPQLLCYRHACQLKRFSGVSLLDENCCVSQSSGIDER